MDKIKRGLSGIYYRYKVGDKWENWVFEDLPETEQSKIMDKYSKKQLSSLCRMLANTLNSIGNQFDITTE